MAKEEFLNAGYTVIGTENNENKLLSFLKENYPNVIRDTEINIEELKAVLGFSIDEKVNGYGLNFVGRNFARAKYAQKTEKELRLNNTLSKNVDTTENLVLKGDNLDSLKILKSHYSGKIKCIYIDPPYNTTGDEFIYPDKFDKEEAEVLGLANLSESDFARMDFSFKTKKSHNGWLAFMYPRLLLARDLLSKEGVIFISIDDNEQANLKMLCDDVFGDENFIGIFPWRKRTAKSDVPFGVSQDYEWILSYNKSNFNAGLDIERKYHQTDDYKNDRWRLSDLTTQKLEQDRPNSAFDLVDPKTGKIYKYNPKRLWGITKDTFPEYYKKGKIVFPDDYSFLNITIPAYRVFESEDKAKALKKYNSESAKKSASTYFPKEVGMSEDGNKEVFEIFQQKIFSFPKPVSLLKHILSLINDSECIILDFFAGSGTTGHAVMQLNAEDGGSRKFILCQIDEPIKEDKPAYQFCIDNNLTPVISSITIERIKRAGEKIAKDIEAENAKIPMLPDEHKQVPDIGFKVFDSVEAPKLKVDEKGQILITENETDALSRIYNMIFTVGLDEPTQVPEEVVKDCIYKIGNHYYITNSQKINSDDYSNAIKNGKVFIDGWTASLNGTLQNYKEDVKIVF
ncbi:MAG: site-specific DNA-methyltransferase [Flavobacterium sp.]|nr:site-specific DNA-methyltransferase [Flavobacterium sp.]